MRVFLLDLWLDLKAKRLAPVALALLAGIIAVPIVLAKSKSVPPPPPPTATTAAAAAGPVVQSQAQTPATDSKLQTFSARDPFEPTKVAAATTGASTPTSGGGTGTTPTATTPTTGNGTTGNGTTTPGGGTTNPTGTTTPEQKTTLFTYTADLKFGTGGDVKTFAGVKRLELIPDDQHTKIVFLGVTTSGKTAVFLVDSNLGVDTGEGRCRPSPDQCKFLYLRPDKAHDEAVLTDTDGTVYHLRLLGINRVTVSSANGTTGNGKSGSGKAKSKAFTGAATSSDGSTPTATPPGEPAKPSSSFQQFFADTTN
jgi:hypothetical protein